MMRAMLIDDEPANLEFISSLISMYCPRVSLMGAYSDPFEGMEAILKQKPDVLLLDIEMPGMTGLELLRRLPAIDFELIFVTAHNQYALNAIKLSALDFLLKPVGPSDLEVALAKAELKLKEKKTLEQLSVLAGLLNNPSGHQPNQQQKIALPTSDGVTYLEMSSIIRIEAEQNYCKFFTLGGTSRLIAKNIGVYEESLESYSFMRVHRSHIVNLHFVTEYIRHDGGQLRMKDSSMVDVSSAKKEELLERLARL
jgi:two-component system LytT family response regulator